MNDIYVGALFSDSYLEHHGILGMKWGVRRFQREDGSLTSVGKKRKVANENKNEVEKNRSKTDKKSIGQKIRDTRNTIRKTKVTNKIQDDIKYWKRDIELSKQYKKGLDSGSHGDYSKKELKEEHRLLDRDIKRAQSHIKKSVDLQKKINSVDVSKYSAKEYKREIDRITKGTFASKR